MSSRLLPFGPDTLLVPAYLAKGNGADDPGFQRWKQEHPDWFVAGTWTAKPSPRSLDIPTLDEAQRDKPDSPAADSRTAARRRQPRPPVPGGGHTGLSASAVADLAAAPLPLLDPSTLSAVEFQRIAAEARGQPSAAPHSGVHRKRVARRGERDVWRGGKVAAMKSLRVIKLR